MAGVKRPVVVGAVAGVVAAVALGGGAAWLLLSSHHAPPDLALSSTRPSGPTAALAGTWTVASGSQVGYRAREKFIDQASTTEAVARTSDLKGSLVVAVDGTTVKVTRMTFTVNLASLVSQDRYANYQVYQRDFFVRTVYLQTDVFPTATFTAGALSFPLPAAGALSVDVNGKLAVHGETRDVTAHVQATASGAQAEVAGTINVDMRNFGIEPPDISFTKAEPAVTIEFDLKLVHA
ncbi:MAG TPA: YceI family protein [Candidatus Dormibacteraeota bacterium]|nr:YceI family protein [Candidatus Dormibacteraeota bacterium]